MRSAATRPRSWSPPTTCRTGRRSRPSATVCAALGFLVGWPALRLAGPYLALVTLALATAVPQILKHPALETWTGGVQGVLLSKPDAPFGLPLSPDQWLYLVGARCSRRLASPRCRG